ncbi:hypothetical protein [Pedobacter zeae]|uniref:GLPGLI family protein n=1 Tax=Pedobacter zeae TaxID=1737356 RepID=A0A7W6KEQ8_9SPHI|nr:hypothetical protein [Pedobacter zeae]MBB4110320.1 hypothetical protein [Pedobacter zeae]GGH17285.1 hypothetical protein GCM10007422_40620 [Pedobacter zeae]
MKYIFLMLTFISLKSYSQYALTPFADVQGTMLREIKYEDVKGSPYLSDNWTFGKVTTKSGKQYVDVPLKYNVMDDKLIFKHENGNQMYFVEPVIAFELNNLISGTSAKFVNGLPAIDHYNALSYYEVIFSGPISLFKKTNKVITESKEYGSALINKSFNTTLNYFALSDGKISKITPNRKAISTLFPSKEQQLNDYLKKEKIDLKNDEDLKKLFAYLN